MSDTSPKQKYDLEKQLKLEQEKRSLRWRSGRRVFRVVLIVVFIVGILAIGGWYISRNNPSLTDPLALCIQHQNISMHTHQELVIVIKGEQRIVPANVGISPTCMRPVHTHDDSGTIHIEFPEPHDATLGDFFKIWGKQFSKDCIFDQCNGPEGTVKMTVNGQPNIEFENYILKDDDRIEIRFE